VIEHVVVVAETMELIDTFAEARGSDALRHTKSGQPGGTFTVEIARWDGTVAVAVTDEGAPSEPAVTDADGCAETGRGLRTVSLLATRWGWFGNDRSRTVAALFTTAASLPEAA
jgi:serine/threonine-protein kinase RsbW